VACAIKDDVLVDHPIGGGDGDQRLGLEGMQSGDLPLQLGYTLDRHALRLGQGSDRHAAEIPATAVLFHRFYLGIV